MLKLIRLISFALVIFTGSLFGFHPNPGGWLIDVEYLYFLPSVDDTFFVIESPTAPTIDNGHRRNNDFRFHSGFRVGGGYAFCNCPRELLLFYTRLSAEQKRTITGNFLSATVGGTFVGDFTDFGGSASSKLHLWYDRVDSFLSQRIFCGCDLNLHLLAGLEWASVRYREKYHYVAVVEEDFLDIDLRSRFWGIGPQFGFDINFGLYEFNCGCLPGRLSLQGWTSGSLLVSRNRERSFANNTGTVVADVRDDNSWRIVPALHARVGLNYATCFSRFAGSLEVGYEFNSYIRALRRIFFTDDVAPNLSLFEDLNFDIHGLYVAANFTF